MILTEPAYLAAIIPLLLLIFVAVLLFYERKKFREADDNSKKFLKESASARMQTEAERKRTETIINSFSDGIIIIDKSNLIFSVNPEADRILGLRMANLSGKRLQSLDSFEKARPLLPILTGENQIVSRKEVELSKDFIIELSATPMGIIGNEMGRLIVLHDVSRERIIERMKSEFVSLAAHQLRTPLSITKWSMSMLQQGDFGKLSKKQAELIERTLQNNDRLISMVNSLLNVTRIEEGKYLYQTGLADIVNIVNSAIDARKEQLESKKIAIDFQKSANLPLTVFDEEKIRMVIQNFIDNAIRYSPPGDKIIITASSDGKNIEIKVQDFGPGIPRSQQDKIFSKFFMGDNATKDNMNGSGLGLFLSKNIIEAHGGTIWFKSDEKAGTSFYFTLPIKEKSNEPVEHV